MFTINRILPYRVLTSLIGGHTSGEASYRQTRRTPQRFEGICQTKNESRNVARGGLQTLVTSDRDANSVQVVRGQGCVLGDVIQGYTAKRGAISTVEVRF